MQVSTELAIPDLMTGHMFFRREPFNINDRGHYGTRESHYQHGNTTFNVIIALPDGFRRAAEVYLRKASGVNRGRIKKISQIIIPEGDKSDVYERLWMPDRNYQTLLPYTMIYWGPTENVEPLQELYAGRDVVSILTELKYWEGQIYSNPGSKK